jgi:hypothetical protein
MPQSYSEPVFILILDFILILVVILLLVSILVLGLLVPVPSLPLLMFLFYLSSYRSAVDATVHKMTILGVITYAL